MEARSQDSTDKSDSRLAAATEEVAPGTGTGINRRRLLKYSGTAVGMAALSGAMAACGNDEPQKEPTGTAAAGAGGKSRELIWVTHGIGDWNVPIDVGFRDFCELAGWKYRKLGEAGSPTPARTVQHQLTAIQAKPDALILTMVDANAFTDSISRAIEEIPYVALNNNVVTETLQKRFPDLAFVGQDEEQAGVTVGRKLVTELEKQGKSEGLILIGNPEPGVPYSENRVNGTRTGILQAGKKFEVSVFDSKAVDQAKSVATYASKLRQAAGDVVGVAAMTLVDSIYLLGGFKEAGRKPQDVVIGAIDTGEEVNRAVKNRDFGFAQDQQLYVQGFLSAAYAWQGLERFAAPPTSSDTGNQVWDWDNVDELINRDNLVFQKATDYGIRK